MESSSSTALRFTSKKFKRDDNDAVLCDEAVELKFDNKILHLAQSWENGEELAPIFSGACWAGTVVWQAALDLCEFMSGHMREGLAGATVVELGCGIGVPGMIARILGSRVVLTEQDELLSLLERNVTQNFPGDDGILCARLDWERSQDTQELLALLRQPRWHIRAVKRSPNVDILEEDGDGDGVLEMGRGAAGSNGADVLATSGEVTPRREVDTQQVAVEGVQEVPGMLGEQGTCGGTINGVDDGSNSMELLHVSGSHPGPMLRELEGGQSNTFLQCPIYDRNPCARVEPGRYRDEEMQNRVSGYPDFILCADCVFEPLYGDSWRALAKVMGRLSDARTRVLVSVERRGEDGVPSFLEACSGEGFTIRMVYKASHGAPAPVELYELRKVP